MAMPRRALIPLLVLGSLVALSSFNFASSKPEKNVTIVDQGTLAIFQNGQRVASETFVIRQFPGYNTTTSELHDETGAAGKIEQSSELSLTADGSLSRYTWKQLSPTRSSATVEPSGDQVLTMRYESEGKSQEQTFLLNRSTFVLDDYFFSTREVLLWRYMASSCQPRPSGDGCDLVKARFPILIPHRRTSNQVFIEFKGFDDMPMNGRPQRLRHFVLSSDEPEWHLWLDADQKLVRIAIPAAGTEILRQ